jgi:spore maturation protein CgeB
LFEAGACATPIISDRWEGLDQLFVPGREIILADGSDEVVAALATDATSLGAAARERTLAAHSSAHRAAELEAHLIGAQAHRPLLHETG